MWGKIWYSYLSPTDQFSIIWFGYRSPWVEFNVTALEDGVIKSPKKIFSTRRETAELSKRKAEVLYHFLLPPPRPLTYTHGRPCIGVMPHVKLANSYTCFNVGLKIFERCCGKV